MSGPQQFASGFIAAPSVQVAFAHPQDLDAYTPLSRPDLYARAPWDIPGAFRERALIDVYASGGWLPDGVPVCALDTDD